MSLIAIVAIQALNILRISHLFFEIKHPINHFEIYHLYVWQFINFVSSMGVFYLLQQHFLKRKGIILRSTEEGYKIKNMLRLTIGSKEENIKFIKATQNIFRK